MKAVILAGGKGERLMPLTKDTPKPMLKIADKPILQYQIEWFKKHGIKEIILCTQYLKDKIIDYFGSGEKFGVKISYPEEKKPLGTAGAVKNAEKLINDNFVVMYGDNLTNLDLTSLIDYHNKKKGIATIALHKKESKSSLVILNKDKQIIMFKERPTEEEIAKHSKQNFVNSGIYILNKDILDKIPSGECDFGKDIFPALLEKNEKIYGYPITDYYREAGRLEKFEKIKEEIEGGINIL